MGASFVVGLYAFERVVTKWFARAGLTFEDDASERAEAPVEVR
jgi:hypothetical protein